MAFTATRSASRLMASLCRENDWSIDEVDGKVHSLFFKGDAIRPKRILRVLHTDGDPIVSFSCICPSEFDANRLTVPTVLVLLHRNRDAFAGWEAHIEDEGVIFSCCYTALTKGLDGKLFRYICTKLLSEVAAVEEAFRQRGIL